MFSAGSQTCTEYINVHVVTFTRVLIMCLCTVVRTGSNCHIQFSLWWCNYHLAVLRASVWNSLLSY